MRRKRRAPGLVALCAAMAIGLGAAGGASAQTNGFPPAADPDGPYVGAAERAITFDGTESTVSRSNYAVVSGAYTWAEAAAAATAFPSCSSAHLATVTSPEEQSTLIETFGSALSITWLGGFQDPSGVEPGDGWEWITGEPWSYTNWQPGEPNDESPGEDALGFGGGVVGEWNDFDENRLQGYLLEGEGCDVDFTWDYGDGTVAADAGPTPSHAYADAGTYDVSLTITDPLGRNDTASTTATIWTVPALMEEVEGLGLPNGTENSLLAKLRAAQASIERGNLGAAAGQLGAFVNAVEAQSGKKIDEADAAELIAIAQVLLAPLGA